MRASRSAGAVADRGLATCGRPPVYPRAEHGRQGGFEGGIQGAQLVGDARAHLPRVITGPKLKVGFEERTDGVIGGRLAIGGRVAFEQEPPLVQGAQRTRKKAALPHPGFPHDGHELPVACTGQRVRLAQRLDLRLAPTQRVRRPRGEGLRRSAGTRPHQLKASRGCCRSPRTGVGPSGLTWTSSSASRRVSVVRRIPPGVASCSIRAARCVVCPMAE